MRKKCSDVHLKGKTQCNVSKHRKVDLAQNSHHEYILRVPKSQTFNIYHKHERFIYHLFETWNGNFVQLLSFCFRYDNKKRGKQTEHKMCMIWTFEIGFNSVKCESKMDIDVNGLAIYESTIYEKWDKKLHIKINFLKMTDLNIANLTRIFCHFKHMKIKTWI